MNIREFIPNDSEIIPLKSIINKDLLSIASFILLLFVFMFYIFWWGHMHAGYLFDPLMQSDDARIWLYPFNMYTDGSPLINDPVAIEKLSFVPNGMWFIYRVLTPFTGVFIVAKFIQGFYLFIIFYAGYVLVTSKSAGVANGILLIFISLNNRFIVNRMAGGLARGFAFPLMILWVAGVFSRRESLRYLALILSSLFYPTVFAILLLTEFFLVLWELLIKGWKINRARVLRSFLFLGLSVLIIIPYVVGTKKFGRSFTYSDAIKEPAYSVNNGRLKKLPFNSISSIIEGKSLYEVIPTVVISFALILVIIRFVIPIEATLFLLSSVVLYTLSRIFAFRLFMPEYFSDYAAPILWIIFILSLLNFIGSNKNEHLKFIMRNFAVTLFMIFLFFVFPNNIRRNNGMSINERSHHDLYSYIGGLPKNILIACHPDDGSDIPLWSARSTIVNTENLLPFTVEFWNFQKIRTFDTLSMLYSTDKKSINKYVSKYGVTHILINENRYKSDFKTADNLFEPFGSYVNKITINLKKEDIILSHLPKESIIFQSSPYLLVDIKKLQSLWMK